MPAPLATRPPAAPPLVGRLGADPQVMRHLHRADIVLIHPRGLQPHALTPDLSGSGQATTSWVPHTSGVDPPPGAITQARRLIKQTDPGNLIPVALCSGLVRFNLPRSLSRLNRNTNDLSELNNL